MSIATFSHVSEKQYLESSPLPGMAVRDIPLPRRSTAGSAGYDFVSPFTITIPAGEYRMIPTGIRARMDEGWVLLIFPRSSLGIRQSLRLSNTTGVIDSDYYNAENEGHIMVPIHNGSTQPVTITRGERFCQGIFLPYGIADEAAPIMERTGGFGSTGR